MKVAIVSDVHTNTDAWQAVRSDLEDQGAEGLWCLGDWLGYSELDPVALWYEISPGFVNLEHFCAEYSACCVVGNHDLALIASDSELHLLYRQYSYNRTARRAIELQRAKARPSEVWNEEFKQWLTVHPFVHSPLRGVYLAHGTFPKSDDDPDVAHHYTPHTVVHSDGFRALQGWLAGSPAPEAAYARAACGEWSQPLLLLTGHSHEQRVWHRDGTHNGEWPDLPGSRIPADIVQQAMSMKKPQPVHWPVALVPTTEKPIWLNPGSVGRPRDGKEAGAGWRWAKYALLDWEHGRGTASLRWVPYQNR